MEASKARDAEFIRAFPRVVRIEPAGACNLRCSHCPTGTVEMQRGVMPRHTFDLAFGAIQRNIDLVKVVVLYHGGEPMLNKHFGEVLRAVKGLGVPFVKTVTNGMLLPDERLDDIVSGGLDAIEFSLDGRSREENDLIRRNCDYDTVVTNVKRLIRYKRSAGSVTPKIYLSNTQFIEKGAVVGKYDYPAPPDYLLQEFSGEWASEITAYKCCWAMRWPHMTVLEDIYDVYQDPNDTETLNTCDHVDNTVTVRWNGEVVGCCYDLTSQFVLGNINQDSLESIWNGRKFLALRRTIANRRFIPMCANCNVVRPNVYLTLRPAVLENLAVMAPAR